MFKLDRSFVAGLARDARKASIISAVLWLARSLGMTVVAEGVEAARPRVLPRLTGPRSDFGCSRERSFN